MGDLFILGAGFSKALSSRMPVTSELYQDIQNGPRASLLDSDLWIKDDLELLLTYLSQPQPWLPESEALRNRANFLDLSREIGRLIEDRLKSAVDDLSHSDCQWVFRLLNKWNSSRTQVITLNYDTLIEIMCGDEAAGSRETGTCGLYPVELKSHVMDGGYIDPPSTLTLYKLHGSINWFYSGKEDFLGEDIYAIVYNGGIKGFYEGKHDWQYSYLKHKVPLIIPPVLDKGTYFRNILLRSTWEQALQELRKADRIFCIGYSLPKTDITMRFFLQGKKKIDKKFYVINPDPAAGDHFHEMLPGYDFNYDFVGNSHCVKQFSEEYCSTNFST